MPELTEAERYMLPLFPERTGAGIRIAVIDSGVHKDHDHIRSDTIAAGVAIGLDGEVRQGTDAVLDRLGHGTAVTAAIQEKATEAICIPVRVFDTALRTSSVALSAAIRWSVAQEVDLINLSLGSTNIAHAALFTHLVEEAREAGIAILAARHAADVPCYPGAIPGVFPVELDWDCPRETLDVNLTGAQPVFRASGYPRAIPGVPRQRNLYGISFAVAQATGFTALAAEPMRPVLRTPDRVEQIRDALVQTACRMQRQL